MALRRYGYAGIGAAMLLLALALISGTRAQAQPVTPPAVSQAWIKLPAVAGRPAAAYFTITGGQAADRLLRVETPLASRVELHESRMEGGAMRMMPVPVLDVAPRSTVRLAPGGKHVMLFGLAPSVTPGMTVKLTLVFANAGKVSVNAQARSVTDTAPSPAAQNAAPSMEGHDHGHHH